MRLTVCDLAKNTCDSHHTPCAVRAFLELLGGRHTACACYFAGRERLPEKLLDQSVIAHGVYYKVAKETSI